MRVGSLIFTGRWKILDTGFVFLFFFSWEVVELELELSLSLGFGFEFEFGVFCWRGRFLI